MNDALAVRMQKTGDAIADAPDKTYASLVEVVREYGPAWPDKEELKQYLLIKTHDWDITPREIESLCDYQQHKKQQRKTPSECPDMPAGLTDVGGTLQKWTDYINRRGFRRQPVLAMCAAVAAFGAVLGRKVQSSMGARTNLYIVGVAPTGSGKDNAMKTNQNVLMAAGMGVEGEHALLGPEDIASDSGLQAHMATQPSTLIQIDEIGKIMRAMSSIGAPSHLANIATVLLRLYTSAGSVYAGKAYADASKRVTVNQPCLCVYGCTVSQSLYQGMTTESMTDGMLARMIIMHGEDDPEEIEPDLTPPDAGFLEEVKQWRGYNGDLGSMNPEPYIVPRDDEAKQIFKDLRQYVKEQRKRMGDSPLGDLWTRCEQKADQLSVIHACSRDGRAAPVVNKESATWARDLSVYAIKRMIYDCRRHVADNETERVSKELEAIIKDAGMRGIALSQLSRKSRGLSGRQRAEVLADLVAMGLVEEVKDSTAGRARTVYRAVRGMV